MAVITRFEEIEAWQQARGLAGEVYSLCRNGRLARDWGLRDQMQRAAVSVMANIAEGFGRQGRRELIQFLESPAVHAPNCNLIYLAKDAQLLTTEQFSAVQDQAIRTGRKISGFISYLASKEAAENTGKVNDELEL